MESAAHAVASCMQSVPARTATTPLLPLRTTRHTLAETCSDLQLHERRPEETMDGDVGCASSLDAALPHGSGVAASVDAETWWADPAVRSQRQRYVLTVEYVGTDYHGSQRQIAEPGGDAGAALTVQDDLETALRKLVPHAPRAPVVIFSGRTDTGVHATGSTAHVDLVRCDRDYHILPPFSEEVLLRSLSHALPKRRLGIVSARRVPLSFHAQRSARMRTYIYKIKCAGGGDDACEPRASPAAGSEVRRMRCCPGLWQYGWISAHDEHRALCLPRPLNVEAMRAAAAVLVGRHDFSAFRGSRCTAGSPVLTLDALDVFLEPTDTLDALRDEPGGGMQAISVRVRGQSFLRKQVRYLVAALLEAGTGRLGEDAEELAAEGTRRILASGNTRWGKPVVPHGLYLARVEYPEEAYAICSSGEEAS